jgi:hypothetical protein
MAFLDKSNVRRLSNRANDFAATGAYRSAA